MDATGPMPQYLRRAFLCPARRSRFVRNNPTDGYVLGVALPAAASGLKTLKLEVAAEHRDQCFHVQLQPAGQGSVRFKAARCQWQVSRPIHFPRKASSNVAHHFTSVSNAVLEQIG